MARNDCCLHFWVGLMAFLQITAGVFRIIQGLMLIGKVDSETLCIFFLFAVVSLVSGSLLAHGAHKKKPKLVFAHIVITVICMVLSVIGLLIIVFFVDGYTGDSLAILAGAYVVVLFILVGLECAVYNFYTNLKSELQDEDTQMTYKV
ncbi:hypothetical protein Zmor_009477 [Zophobas morio]|uniref:Uncharacterized protein n=1 Tax=Zophobas morio TaxID=2755281 RepID=A0AA38IJ04_9CUCU|nr:hypothetical protein Zmor_009477 [Zophobas morio]